MPSLVILYWCFSWTAALVCSQNEFAAVPEISRAVKDYSQEHGTIASFLDVWDFALHSSGQESGTTVRITLEPKTILAPHDVSFINLIPQDASHPLYLTDAKHSDLRREFLMDHLILERIPPDSEALKEEGGVRTLTFSGKELILTKDPDGVIHVGGGTARHLADLDDGTVLYVVQEPLFDAASRVRSAFDVLHRTADILGQGPFGPPLDIEGAVGPRAPAPPPAGVVGPPAPPPRQRGKKRRIQPPAPPREEVLHLPDE